MVSLGSQPPCPCLRVREVCPGPSRQPLEAPTADLPDRPTDRNRRNRPQVSAMGTSEGEARGNYVLLDQSLK